MTETNTKVITKKQAKKEIGIFGRPLAFYLFVMLVFRALFPYLYNRYAYLFGDLSSDTVRLSATIIIVILITITLFRRANRKLNLNIKTYLKNPHLSFFTMLTLVCIGIGIYLASIGISSLFYFLLPTNQLTDPYLGNFSTRISLINNILYACLYIIIKPLCDEYIFRGIIQRQLGHYGRYFGVLGAAFLYALAQPTLIRAIPSFFVGWYLGFVTLKYHSIRPGFVIHVWLHLFIWILDILPGNYLWVATILIAIVYIVSALGIFQKRVSTHLIRYGATEWKLWKILLTTPSIILCIILFILNVIVGYL